MTKTVAGSKSVLRKAHAVALWTAPSTRLYGTIKATDSAESFQKYLKKNNQKCQIYLYY